MGDLWNDIEKSLGLESNIILSTQYGGAPDQDGNWKGMMGMVQRNEVHVAVSDFFPTPVRSQTVDFTTPILNTG